MKSFTDLQSELIPDELNENKVQDIATLIKVKGTTLMNLGKSLEDIFPKKSISFVLSPIAHYRIKVGHKTLIIVNKRYADDAEVIVGELAIGYEGKI